ncbi:MAG TPA: FAD binding domain-containing protein [Vicinamibacterales bacterium]|nr:FAD binding domain-containing protein [Vicinamibacterales bacterium]
MPYAAPRSLDEAVSLLTRNRGARVLAGGHTLLLEPSRSQTRGALLVDLRLVPNLTGISNTDGGLRIGAMTTLSDIVADARVRTSYGVLAEIAERTGDVQLRNRATLGGNLANPDHDNEFPAIAVLLAATIDIAGKKARAVDADDFFSAKVALATGEIITAINLPARLPRTGVAYVAHRNPATRAPICGVGVGLALGEDLTVTSCRVVLVGATDRPTRLSNVEKTLAKARAADARQAAAGAGEGATMRTDLFASADYRKHLTGVLTERALNQALERAGG